MNKADTISQRSFLPIGFNLSLNGTIVVCGTGALFLKQNRFRIYLKYAYRDEPSNYYGVGYQTIEHTEREATTELYEVQVSLYRHRNWGNAFSTTHETTLLPRHEEYCSGLRESFISNRWQHLQLSAARSRIPPIRPPFQPPQCIGLDGPDSGTSLSRNCRCSVLRSICADTTGVNTATN